VLIGGFGTDTARYDGATSGVVARLDDASLNTGDAAGDTYFSVDGLRGSNHADTLHGNSVRNVLVGGGGNDILNGRAGNDTLFGGAGNDAFRLSDTFNSSNVDRIEDFDGTQDRIELFRGQVRPLVSSSEFRLGTQALDSNDFLIYAQATGELWFDRDGDGAIAKQLIAVLDPGTALAFNDFGIYLT
jgi:serralysin